MRKRIEHPTRTVQLIGAEIKISEIHNDRQREHVAIINQGAQSHPMNGWALATLRGECVYFFPDDLILSPGMTVTVHSGEDALARASRQKKPGELHVVWTTEQMWNNRQDIAVLFNALGLEVSRHVYPHDQRRSSGRSTRDRVRLLREGETYQIVGEPKPKAPGGAHKGRHDLHAFNENRRGSDEKN